MNEILKEHLEKVNGTAGTSTGLDFLQLKHESGNYYAANTYLIALKELAALRARVGELERDLESGFMQGAYARLKNLQEAERERDAAVSDLQDAVDFVYKVYGESNETLAAITTGHWRVVIASAKGAK